MRPESREQARAEEQARAAERSQAADAPAGGGAVVAAAASGGVADVLVDGGTFTSAFGIRNGVQHFGIDIAAPVGTPVHVLLDGVVIDSRPAAGFGLGVQVEHADGTVTTYGHVDV